MKLLTYDQTKCNFCGACQIVCSLSKKDRIDPAQARIRIQTAGDTVPLRAVVCQHCEEPVCVTACMRGIIEKDKETGLVKRRFEDCFRCAACHVMCPIGAAVLDEDLKAFVTCDLCCGDPLCVKICPTGALRYENAEESSENLRNQYARMALGQPGTPVLPGVMVRRTAPELTKAEEKEQWKKISETIASALGKRVSPTTLKRQSKAIREAAVKEGEA